MSVYATLDGGEPAMLASNTGYGDFCRWADSLPAGANGEIAHLRHFGWEQDLPALADQVHAALRSAPPGKDVADVALALLAIIDGSADAEVLTITTGFGKDSGGAGEESAGSGGGDDGPDIFDGLGLPRPKGLRRVKAGSATNGTSGTH